jgi:hypothetical protein
MRHWRRRVKWGEKLANPDAVLKQAGVSHIGELFYADMKLCDSLADTAHDRAIAMAAAEGGVTGATGLLGIAVDVPTLMTLALCGRFIKRTLLWF